MDFFKKFLHPFSKTGRDLNYRNSFARLRDSWALFRISPEHIAIWGSVLATHSESENECVCVWVYEGLRTLSTGSKRTRGRFIAGWWYCEGAGAGGCQGHGTRGGHGKTHRCSQDLGDWCYRPTSTFASARERERMTRGRREEPRWKKCHGKKDKKLLFLSWS